jgi:hypothetical protein
VFREASSRSWENLRKNYWELYSKKIDGMSDRKIKYVIDFLLNAY